MICPNCHKENSAAAAFCDSCGTPLNTMPPEQETLKGESSEKETEQTETDRITCSSCGKQSTLGESFCEYCGAAFSSQTAEEKKPEEKSGACPFCGHINSEEGYFCDSCGHRLKKTNEGVPKKRKGTDLKRRLQTMSKQQRLVSIGMLLFVLLLVGVYGFGRSYYSKESQLERYQEILATHNGKRIAEAVQSSDPHFKPTKDTLQAWTDYMAANKGYATALVDDLSNATSEGNDLYLRKNGRYLLFFDKYDLVLQPVYFNISTNVKNMLLKLNSSEQGSSDSEAYVWKLGPFAPGEYTLTGSFTSNKKESAVKQTVEQIDRIGIEKNNTRNLLFQVSKLKMDITAPISNSEILFDGETLGNLDDGGSKTIEMVWHDEAKLQIKQKIGDLELISAPLVIDPDNYLESSYTTEASKYNVELTKASVSSNAQTGTVFINNKSVGALKEGKLNSLQLVKTEKPLSLQVKQTLEDGEIASEMITLDSEAYSREVYLEMDAGIDSSEVRSFLAGLYSKVTDYTNDRYTFSEVEAKTLTTYFVGGVNNAEYIDFKDNFIIPTRSSQNKSYVSGSVDEVEQVKRVGMNKYHVQYIVNYRTYFKDSMRTVNQYFRYKQATLLTEGNDLKINDLGGEENFEEVHN